MTPSSPRDRRRVWQWADVRGRNLGLWAYLLNRLTGLGLTAYLFLHLAVLYTLTQGPDGWNRFIGLARQPAFLFLDVILLAGLLIHGLNGLRLILNSLGVGVRAQKQLFLALMAAGALVLGVGAYLMFSK